MNTRDAAEAVVNRNRTAASKWWFEQASLYMYSEDFTSEAIASVDDYIMANYLTDRFTDEQIEDPNMDFVCAVAAKWLMDNEHTFEFAAEMKVAMERWGRLSTGQMRGVLNTYRAKVIRENRPFSDADATEDSGPSPLKPLADMLVAAKATLKNPSLTFPIGDKVVRLSWAGEHSRNFGNIYVAERTGWGQDGDFYGMMDAAGKPNARLAESPVYEELCRIAAGGREAFEVAGKELGRCCFCYRELSTKESLAAGYGPICAGKYGLEWGGA